MAVCRARKGLAAVSLLMASVGHSCSTVHEVAQMMVCDSCNKSSKRVESTRIREQDRDNKSNKS
jgi:ribosome-binding protein aMBF1 (putative translation factor)